MTLLLAVFVVAVLSGATAAVAGFGIGSLLTPLLALRVGTLTAVTLVAIPHLCATAVRGWRLRRAIDRDVLRRFGILSAAGSLAGALLAVPLGARGLTLVLGVLLCLTGVSALSGLGARTRISPGAAWLLGILSGLFGGLAGNQGGVRAVALLRFDLTPMAFVATSTASALLVDLARVPVYLWRGADVVAELWPAVAVATAGVLLGTLLGERILLGLTPQRFRKVVGSVVLAVGLTILLAELR
ncbi:MAG TPA: sulfite exporter TauE/SafE family protein [Gemmatimonadaceae bacterium]|nr:sulfite exporter TauE/SafE family protein [Gemmatimonadaceae bacterium]